jgi:hypothetical protein
VNTIFWPLVSIGSGVVLVRLALPAIYGRALSRWMRRHSVEMLSFGGAPDPAAAPELVPAAMDSIAQRSMWIRLAACGLVVLSAICIHLSFVEPNPIEGRPDLTAGAMAWDALLTAPFLFFALQLPANPVSWWLNSIIPGVFVGMGLWVTLSSLDQVGPLLLLVHLGLVLLVGWFGTIALLTGLRGVTRLAGQSSATAGLTQAATFGLAAFAFFEINAVGGVRPLALLLPVLVMTVGLNLALPREKGPPRSLLFLRTFASRRRSSQIINRLGRVWLSGGPIYAVQGPDLAKTTLETRDLIAALVGRMRSRFVVVAEDVDRIYRRGRERHRDGRFSHQSFHCLDNTWRATVESAAARVDYIIMDLRGLTSDNRGTLFELTTITRMKKLDRAAFLLDDGALALARQTAADAGGSAIFDQRIVRTSGDHRKDVTALLECLSSAPHLQAKPLQATP